MADTKISALTAATSVAGTEQIPLATAGGANNKITPETLASVVLHPGYVAGRWYMAPISSVTGGSAMVANTIKLYPFMVAQRITISDFGARVVTGGASTHLKVAIYASDATTKMPTGTPIASSVGILDTSTSTTTPSITLTTNISLTPGIYWMASLSDGTPVLNAISISNVQGNVCAMIGNSSLANLWPAGSALNTGYTYSTSVTYAGGFADLTSATLTENGSGASIPAIAFKVASVP